MMLPSGIDTVQKCIKRNVFIRELQACPIFGRESSNIDVIGVHDAIITIHCTSYTYQRLKIWHPINRVCVLRELLLLLSLSMRACAAQ